MELRMKICVGSESQCQIRPITIQVKATSRVPERLAAGIDGLVTAVEVKRDVDATGRAVLAVYSSRTELAVDVIQR
jgi:hypothetical protein